jgi:hypothetical protein
MKLKYIILFILIAVPVFLIGEKVGRQIERNKEEN